MDFTIGYSSKSFDGKITAGVMTVEADSIETVQGAAFGIVMQHFKDDQDDEEEDWHENLQNLQISIS
ncbi:MAG TPA: hypothetical protein VF609_13275 [Flavisolibacter sp.]|jgi:hypothetical protein